MHGGRGGGDRAQCGEQGSDDSTSVGFIVEGASAVGTMTFPHAYLLIYMLGLSSWSDAKTWLRHVATECIER